MSGKFDSRIPVLIASSLKPAKDTRAYGKLGLSLRETGLYRLSFMGFSHFPLENCEDENFYTSVSKTNSAWGRISSQVRFLRILLKARPKILICCTYEYLPIASFLKEILGYKLVYDVQENYVKNLDLNPVLSPDKRASLSRIIRKLERINRVDLFLLAEKSYAEEMPEKTPFLILENKFAGEIKVVAPLKIPRKEGYDFLISGTLTPAFGTLEAVAWFKEILKVFPKSTLTIIGHCTVEHFKKELLKACKNTPEINLKTSLNPVPHEEILAAYSGIDFAVLPYQNKEAIRDKRPTKLFESAALGVPVLISPNPKWFDFLDTFSGGFPIDFFDLTQASLHFSAALERHYFTQSPDSPILWKSQHKDFITAIASL